MTIEVQNDSIRTNEHGQFDIVEKKKSTSKTTGKPKITETVIGFGMSLEYAIKQIIHLNIHNNPNVVSLKQFITHYKAERRKIEKLVEFEIIQNH